VSLLAVAYGWDPPRGGVTIATRHPRLGYSTERNGGVLHVVKRVVLSWHHGALVSRAASWSCGPNGSRGEFHLVDEPPEGMVWCRRCDVAGVQVAESVVYGARVGELIKIGTTRQLASRMVALGGDLLWQVAGDVALERAVHASLVDHLVAGREWFEDCAATRTVPVVLEAAVA